MDLKQIILLYLLGDTLCVDLLSQSKAHLPEALWPLTLSSAANCAAIGLQHRSLFLWHQQDVTKLTGLAFLTGEDLQHGSGQEDPLWETETSFLIDDFMRESHTQSRS